MPSEERKGVALEAIRPRIEQFHSAVAKTAEQIRGLLGGTGDAPDDQTASLGFFARGQVNVERFSVLHAESRRRIDEAAEAPTRAAQDVLDGLLARGDELFVLTLQEGEDLAGKVARRLAQIGRAFSAAHVVELAQRGEYRGRRARRPCWNAIPSRSGAARSASLAPGLVIELSGAVFHARLGRSLPRHAT